MSSTACYFSKVLITENRRIQNPRVPLRLQISQSQSQSPVISIPPYCRELLPAVLGILATNHRNPPLKPGSKPSVYDRFGNVCGRRYQFPVPGHNRRHLISIMGAGMFVDCSEIECEKGSFGTANGQVTPKA